jgi:hypothetical protein
MASLRWRGTSKAAGRISLLRKNSQGYNRPNSEEDWMCAWSANCQLFVAASTAVLLFSQRSIQNTHEAAMNPEQNVDMSSLQRGMSEEQATRTIIERFNEAFNGHDADALSALLTDDTVFKGTSPRRMDGASSARPP